MLDFLLAEWEKDDSLIYGRYNKPCDDEMFNNETQQHNSLYWMYRNILNIALLFRDEVFYFPVFMDFRGIIYPLVNYLTYQGQCGKDHYYASIEQCVGNNNHILIYLCNVFGVKGMSMNDRIDWAHINIPIILDPTRLGGSSPRRRGGSLWE